MNASELEGLFIKHADEYGKWERVAAEDRRHVRPDLHVFLLLHERFPCKREKPMDMVSSASHDEIWLDVSPHGDNTLTEDELVSMIRAGLRYDSDSESFCMFA